MQSEQTQMTVSERVERNLDLAKGLLLETDPDRRTALRYLFTSLFYLEAIAQLAAERGRGIPGQVEDEIVHGKTFGALAEAFGGLESCPSSIQELTLFIEALDGELSLAVLNIVAETWLENVFRHIGKWGIAPSMFQAIADEERRHSHEALQLAKPEPGEAKPFIRELERLLYSIILDPYFTFPLAFLSGVRAMGYLNKSITEGHISACEALGVQPSAALHEVVRCGNDAIMDARPASLQLTPWEASAFNVTFQGPIVAYLDTPYRGPKDRAFVEAVVLWALSTALGTHPRLNRSLNVARQEIYQCKDVQVGVRRLYDTLGDVMTVPIVNGFRRDLQELKKDVRGRSIRQRMMPYPQTPDLTPLARIIPPPRISATLVNMMGSGIERGRAALADMEGASISVGIASIEDLPTRWVLGLTKWVPHIRLSVVMDHRCHNGKELGLLAGEIKKLISEEF